jgi:protein-disulfide isomerase
MEYEAPQLTKAERRALKKDRKREEEEKQQQQSKMKRWMTYLAMAAVVVGLGWLAYSRYTPIPAEEVNKPVSEITETDWVKGNREAKVVLVEYSDFQCPACKAYRELIEALQENYSKDQLALVFRHFPLKTIHPQATLAAQATEAAGNQGNFWEMHDVLFENQAEWSGKREAEEMFISYATQLGLDENQFKQDLKSKEVQVAVEADYRNGMSLRINSTPSFFVNGERIANPQGLEPFQAIIDEALRSATESGEVAE